MSRRTAAAGPTISLFPFLAVLLCTMGALLVLLVLFSRSASLADSDEGGDDGALALALEEARWRRGVLDESRRRTEEDLSRARMALAAVEENTRALEDEIDRLAREADALVEQAAAADDGELAGLEARLRDARESLDVARADRAKRPPAYAVVPYVGKQGTHRRPLYIECAVDGVYLQPEGIRLQPGDFDGPPGPGNPLASALRAAREHLARSSANPGDPASQPYPLLLVRPSGVMAYYAAREAIVSWGSEFGYQFIDDDWEIAYPPPDQALAEAESRAVEESRRRLQWLAENHPQRPSRPPRQYRAAPTRGGVVANDGPSLLGDQAQFEWTGGDAAGGRAARGSGGPGGRPGGVGGPAAEIGAGGGPGRPFLATGRTDDASGDAILGRPGGASGGPAGGVVVAGGAAGQGAPGGLQAFAPSAVPGTGGADGGAPRPGAAGDPSGGGPGGDRYAADGRSTFTAARSGAPGGMTPGSGAGNMAAASGGSDAGSAAGSPSGTTAGNAAAAGNPAFGGGNDASGGAGGEVSMPGMVGAQGGGGSSLSVGGAAGSIANSRGANWASLATRDRPVPLTRPIHVECALDEFRLLDDTGRRVERRVPIPGDTAAAVDPFVGALHATVRGWGIAGERMYWRPQLVLTATVDGESRRDDLERLLADSGIDIRPRDGGEEVKALPPVQRVSYEFLLR